MKILSKEEMKAVAADIFNRNTKCQKVAVTSDGMAFIIDESENAVLNHSKNNRHKKELDIIRFTRDGIVAGSGLRFAGKKTVKELVAEIETETNVVAIEAILAAEKEGEKRKGVIDVAEKRIKELKPE